MLRPSVRLVRRLRIFLSLRLAPEKASNALLVRIVWCATNMFLSDLESVGLTSKCF